VKSRRLSEEAGIARGEGKKKEKKGENRLLNTTKTREKKEKSGSQKKRDASRGFPDRREKKKKKNKRTTEEKKKQVVFGETQKKPPDPNVHNQKERGLDAEWGEEEHTSPLLFKNGRIASLTGVSLTRSRKTDQCGWEKAGRES